ncbi:hypothetical protein [Methylobacterium hispanicum]|uniref:hypothetical protein n=1 Tax=Methylobacterium hispanicum TaxID=270350 RepID=UPI002F3285ED
MSGRLIPWATYVADRPSMDGCPANGLLGITMDWDGAGEVTRIAGVLASGREVPLVDLVSETPRPILSDAEVDSMVRAAIEALAPEATP